LDGASLEGAGNKKKRRKGKERGQTRIIKIINEF